MNYYKLLQLLTPTFLRVGYTALLSAVAAPISTLYTDFKLWQRELRLQSAITCQVIYLEYLLNDRLGNVGATKIYITDGDGMERDFVVNMPVGVALDYRLQAYLNKYKMAGKRYTIEQTSNVYGVNWTGWLDELVTPTYVVEWTGWVNELVDGRIDNDIDIEVGETGTTFRAKAGARVTSNVTVSLLYVFSGVANELTDGTTIVSGEQVGAWKDNPTMDGQQLVEIKVIGVSPMQDGWYNYTY